MTPALKDHTSQDKKIKFKVKAKIDFGTAFHATHCPICEEKLYWLRDGEGCWQAACCGKLYEMYAEQVSFAFGALDHGQIPPRVALLALSRRRGKLREQYANTESELD